MAKQKLGSSFLGVQQGLTVIKNHCYAYSGATDVADTDEHKLLSFHTGDLYMVVEFIFWRRSWEDDDIAYYVEMNGSQVLAWIGRVAEPQGTNQQIMVLPPRTLVEAYVDKQNHSSDSIVGINVTGKVYE